MRQAFEVLRYTFISSMRRRFLAALMPALALLAAAYIVSTTPMKLGWVLPFYVVVLIPAAGADAIDRNITLRALSGFPVTFSESLTLLSWKMIASDLAIGIPVLAAARSLVRFPILQWVDIMVAAVYLSAVLFFGMQVGARRTLKVDLLFIFVEGAVVAGTAVIWALVYRLSPLLQVVWTAALVVSYHALLLNALSARAERGVCELLEKFS